MNKVIFGTMISSCFISFFPLNLPSIPLKTIETKPAIIQEALQPVAPREKTIYDVYSSEELDLLFRVVESEARGGSVTAKMNVASVIFNRVKGGWEGGDLTSILLKPRQFEVVTLGIYKRVNVTKSTIIGCEKAFKQDSVQGAVYFDSTKGTSWAAEECRKGNLIWVFRDEINHDFYRKKKEGE